MKTRTAMSSSTPCNGCRRSEVTRDGQSARVFWRAVAETQGSGFASPPPLWMDGLGQRRQSKAASSPDLDHCGHPAVWQGGVDELDRGPEEHGLLLGVAPNARLEACWNAVGGKWPADRPGVGGVCSWRPERHKCPWWRGRCEFLPGYATARSKVGDGSGGLMKVRGCGEPKAYPATEAGL